jgi:release factor glutamine methyltransferase
VTLDTEAGLTLLGRALDDSEYPEFLALFEPNSVRPEAWLAARASLAGETAQLVDFLLLGRRVARREIPNGIAESLSVLEGLGLCGHDPEGDLVWLPGLCLTRVRGMWLLAQRPQIAPTLYVGDDSLALANHLVVGPGAALDLCAGPGLQALVCAICGSRAGSSRGRPGTSSSQDGCRRSVSR